MEKRTRTELEKYLYGAYQGYWGMTAEEGAAKEGRFKAIIENAKTKEFIVTLNDGSKATMRLFISVNDTVCFVPKGKRSRGYMLHLGRVADICAKVKAESDKFRQFHRNAERVAQILRVSGFWPDILKRVETEAAMTEDEYTRLAALHDEYFDYGSHEGMTYEEGRERDRKIREEFNAYYEKHGAKGDIFHFRDFSKPKQVISVPYGDNDSYADKEYGVACTLRAIEQVKGGEADYLHRHWRGSYDYSVSVRREPDGTIKGWYNAEFKGCGNGHYYLLLDATHALFYEDD